MTFSVSTRRDGDTLTVRVAGDLDLATADELAQAVAAAGEGYQEIVVDLADTRFIDSAGINALLRGRRTHQRYHVINATGIVLDVLRLGGVWEHLSEPPR
ncbi:STAS domain-containing protein [Dactylosporangium sp. AC04546]|uniref:STAS domain-containing protein n=1 Tax=Dactylosporangium sp. AC04546 TaxID=2862460 RepID=UPI001EDFF7FC|nr:STAS domain-containing protein [Dactylosporangium sp. AC04546]WVK87778.1 STAS domain-containing protein [Dactylosporangium sp. AC04546]